MMHGSEYIPFDFSVAVVQLIQHFPYFLSLRGICAGAWVYKLRATFLFCKTSDRVLVNKSKGPYQRKPSLKESLGRHHAADFAGVTNIHKERFNVIVFIMS